jgi:hypothetical protein
MIGWISEYWTQFTYVRSVSSSSVSNGSRSCMQSPLFSFARRVHRFATFLDHFRSVICWSERLIVGFQVLHYIWQLWFVTMSNTESRRAFIASHFPFDASLLHERKFRLRVFGKTLQRHDTSLSPEYARNIFKVCAKMFEIMRPKKWELCASFSVKSE